MWSHESRAATSAFRVEALARMVRENSHDRGLIALNFAHEGVSPTRCKPNRALLESSRRADRRTWGIMMGENDYDMRISRRAYGIWEDEGLLHGRALNHRLRTEAQIGASVVPRRPRRTSAKSIRKQSSKDGRTSTSRSDRPRLPKPKSGPWSFIRENAASISSAC